MYIHYSFWITLRREAVSRPRESSRWPRYLSPLRTRRRALQTPGNGILEDGHITFSEHERLDNERSIA